MSRVMLNVDLEKILQAIIGLTWQINKPGEYTCQELFEMLPFCDRVMWDSIPKRGKGLFLSNKLEETLLNEKLPLYWRVDDCHTPHAFIYEPPPEEE